MEEGKHYLVKTFYGEWRVGKVCIIDGAKYFNIVGSYIDVNQVEEVR